MRVAKMDAHYFSGGSMSQYSDIVVASLKMAQRMGPGMYGIWWELKEEGGKTK